MRPLTLTLLSAGLLACQTHDPRAQAPGEALLFSTPQAALRYLFERYLCEPPRPDDPTYESSFLREFQSHDGTKTTYLLHSDAPRESALAESFFHAGLFPEALVHYRNLFAYAPNSPQAKRAADLGRLQTCAARNYPVRPFSPVLSLHDGSLLVPLDTTEAPDSPLWTHVFRARNAADETVRLKEYRHALDLIASPGLPVCSFAASGTPEFILGKDRASLPKPRGAQDRPPFVAGLVDDIADRILTPPSHEPILDRAMALRSGRLFYLLPQGSRSIADGVQRFRREVIAEFDRLLGPVSPETAADHLRVAMAFVLTQQPGRALKRFRLLPDSPEKTNAIAALDPFSPAPPTPAGRYLQARRSLLTGRPHEALAILREIESQPNHPFGADAAFLLRRLTLPYLEISTTSMTTSSASLPLRIVARNVPELRFLFSRINDPPPDNPSDIKAFLTKQKESSAPVEFEETLRLPEAPPGRRSTTTVDLPIRSEGLFRVTAVGPAVEVSFFACRTETRATLVTLPGSAIAWTHHASDARPGIRLYRDRNKIGETDAEGIANLTGPIATSRPNITCAEHADCCSGCDSCEHHHGAEVFRTLKLTAKPGGASALLLAPGLIARAWGEIPAEAASHPPLPASGPLLYVYTDRPTYKAGDTVRFRGIFRRPLERIPRRAQDRYAPAANEELTVSIVRESDILFRRIYFTGEFGTFHGEFRIPLSAARSVHKLQVECKGGKAERPFLVMDYKKTDHIILLTPDPEGFRVTAGYVWGAPVTDAVVQAFVDNQETSLDGNLVRAKEGQRVRVVLRRGDQELAAREALVRARPKPAAASTPAAPNAEPPSSPADPSPPPAPPAPFRVIPARDTYGRGETIEAQLEGPAKQCLVVVGDVHPLDWAFCPLADGKGTVRLPATGSQDPGTYVHAIFLDDDGHVVGKASAPVTIQANLLPVRIVPSKKSAKPGETIEVALQSLPGSALSLAGVDEAIYMFGEDDTPEIYSFFYPPRPTALAAYTLDRIEFDGETVRAEGRFELPCLGETRLVADRVLRAIESLSDKPFPGAGMWDVIGVGGGGSGRLGGRLLRYAAGGGAWSLEEGILDGLRPLLGLQNPDGSYGPETVDTGHARLNPVGLTSLATLSFLGAGYSHLSHDTFDSINTGEVVRKAIQFLLSSQGGDGHIGPREGDSVANHILATFTLSEAFGLTGSQVFRGPAQRALDLLPTLQNPDGGWPAKPGNASDPIVTALAVQAIQSAQTADLAWSRDAVRRAWDFVAAVLDEEPRKVPARVSAAVALAGILLTRDKADPRIRAHIEQGVNAAIPAASDLLLAYYGFLCTFHYDGPSGSVWKAFQQNWKPIVVPKYHPAANASRAAIVYANALKSLCCEVYYRYPNVLVDGKNGDPGPPLVEKPRVRVDFPDTIIWIPEIVTDARGEARIQVLLGDAVTTTRFTSRGVGPGTAVGEAVERVTTELPFFVQLQAPSFFVRGDTATIRAEVFNYTRNPLDAGLTLQGDGFSLESAASRQVRIAAKDRATASWRIRIENSKGVTLRAVADAGSHRDAIERTIPVIPAGIEQVLLARAEVKAGQVVRVEVPPDREPRDVRVRVHPRKPSLTQILDALRYLNGYPYG